MGSIAKELGDYNDFVEDRITHLADEARVHRRGVDEQVRRTWAWPRSSPSPCESPRQLVLR